MPRMLVIAFLNFLIPFFGVVAIPPCPQGEKISSIGDFMKTKTWPKPCHDTQKQPLTNFL